MHIDVSGSWTNTSCQAQPELSTTDGPVQDAHTGRAADCKTTILSQARSCPCITSLEEPSDEDCLTGPGSTATCRWPVRLPRRDKLQPATRESLLQHIYCRTYTQYSARSVSIFLERTVSVPTVTSPPQDEGTRVQHFEASSMCYHVVRC